MIRDKREFAILMLAFALGPQTMVATGLAPETRMSSGKPTDVLPVETFFRNFQYNEVALSPDGNFLAALAPDKKRVGLVVIDLKDRKANWAYVDRSADICAFIWASNSRLLLWFSKDGYGRGGLMAVNRDGTKRTVLVPFNNLQT